MKSRFATVVWGLALLTMLVVAAPAAAKTEVAERGSVRAELSYERAGTGTFREVTLRVDRDGQTLVDEPGPRLDGGACSRTCDLAPQNAGAGRRSIRLLNLDADAEPEVLADFLTGGVRCCVASRIYDFDPGRGDYVRISRDWRTGGHSGPRDLDADGSFEFVSSDGRFRERFGCGACTPEPVQVLRLRAGRITDVTRRFRGRITRDLASLRRIYRRRAREDPLAARGVMAAIVAERYLLGQPRRARRTLDRALRRGDLRRPKGDRTPGGRAYVRSLLRFLRNTNYR